MQMTIIAYVIEVGGWCVVNLSTHAVLAGPYDTHQDAEEAVRTRAWRISQGWAP